MRGQARSGEGRVRECLVLLNDVRGDRVVTLFQAIIGDKMELLFDTHPLLYSQLRYRNAS